MAEPLIRSVKPEDGDDLAALYGFPDVMAQTGQLPGNSAEFWLGHYRRLDPNAVERVADIDGRVVGHVGILTSTNPRRKHVASFGIVVHPDYQGRGVGKALMAALCDLSDNWLNIVRLELSVFADNERAIGLYEKFGFEREGVARAALFREGEYADSLGMARIRLG